MGGWDVAPCKLTLAPIPSAQVSCFARTVNGPVGVVPSLWGKAMRRREFIALIGGGAAWPLAARAQAKVYVVGILETVPRAQNQASFAALLKGLREHGYVEGQNLRI